MIETSKLHAYVDGELSDAERREVEIRLADCKESQAEIASIKGLKGALILASNIEYDEVWANCKDRLDAIDRVAKSGNFITKYSWAFVSAVAMIVIVGGGFARHAQSGSVDSSALAGVFSSSGHPSAEKQSQNAQLDELLRSADLNLSKIKLLGWSEGMVNGFTAVRYDLQDAKGRMWLISLPQVSSFDGMTPNQDGTYFFGQIETNKNAVGWKTKNAALILIGARDFASLEEFARNHIIHPE